jgi:hypothetical protein
MVVVLVHWLITKGREKDFEDWWRKMSVRGDAGLYREILTAIDTEPPDSKFHTFSVGDPFYSTYINVGIWNSLEEFDAEIGKRIPKAEVFEQDGQKRYTITLEDFEFKLRERVVLKVIADRGGHLPDAEMRE